MKYLIAILFPSAVILQQLRHQMISPKGNTNQLENAMTIYSAVGQSVKENSSQKSFIMQQGFQQCNWVKIIDKNPHTFVTTITVPNPFVDVVNFKFSNTIDQTMDVFIFDITGRIVFSQKTNIFNNEASINFSNLGTAVYLVRFSAENFEYFTKIIKQIH